MTDRKFLEKYAYGGQFSSMHRSRSLPSESQVKAYMDGLQLSDANSDDLELGVNIQNQKADITTGDFPDLDLICIHRQFNCRTLVPKIVPPEKDAVDNNDYSRYCKWEDTQQIEDLKLTHPDLRSQYQTTKNHGSSFGTYVTTRFLDEIRIWEQQAFVAELVAKDYVHEFNEADLKLEIRERTRQYPGSLIYVFMGKRLMEYYEKLFGKVTVENAAIILAGDTYRHSSYAKESRPVGNLCEYEAAVLAQNGVRSNASFHSSYRFERVTRAYSVSQSYLMKFALEVDRRIPPKSNGQMRLFNT